MNGKKLPHFFANWKMYLDYEESVALAKELAQQKFSGIKMAVFPSALAAPAVAAELKNTGILVGAQNFHWVDRGGYTGEVSAGMYKNIGASYTLVGHSERRHLFHESNHETRQKLEAALAASLTPVLCVGETLPEREAHQTEEVVEAQLRAALTDLAWPGGQELIIAYEPVWSIGTGLACEPEEAERMHKLIIKLTEGLIDSIEPTLLYGGSVRPENVSEYFLQQQIHGVLVGGASVKLESWLKIAGAAVS